MDSEQSQKLAEAAALARSHHFAEADQTLEDVTAPSDPKLNIAYHRLRASIAAGLQKPEQASAEMTAALALSPGDPDLVRATALADLAWVNSLLKQSSHPQLPAALEALRALSLPGPQQAELREQLGKALLTAGEFKSAIVDLSEAMRLNPGDAPALALLGDAYEAVGESVESARSFEEAVRLSPGEEAFRLALAVELLKHQTFAPALAVLERAALDFPRSPRIRTALGLALFLSGNEAEGIAKLLDALDLDPAFAPALRYLSEISLTQTEPPQERLVKVMCGYAAAHSSDEESNLACASLQARALPEEASASARAPILKRLASAAQASPHSAPVHCEYGKALDQAHDWPQARRELEACAALDPNSVEAHFRLARLYQKLGLKEHAAKQIALRAAAEQQEAALNDARFKSLTIFLYSMTKP